MDGRLNPDIEGVSPSDTFLTQVLARLPYDLGPSEDTGQNLVPITPIATETTAICPVGPTGPTEAAVEGFPEIGLDYEPNRGGTTNRTQ